MYLVFDTETTGLPKNWKAPMTDTENWPRMVQIAWLTFNEKYEETGRYEYIIKPEDYRIPMGAARVHGITTERAEAEGQDLAAVLQAFANGVEQAEYIIAHNISFDEKIVGAEFIRKEIKHQLFQRKRLCTKELSTDFCQIPGKYGYKWPTLEELYGKLFGESLENAHDAFVDAEATAKSFFKLKELGEI